MTHCNSILTTVCEAVPSAAEKNIKTKMESACCYAASFFCRYLFSWSALFTHIVSFGLLFSLAKQNVNVGQFIHTAVRFEVVQLVLWLFVPMEKLAVVLALWYCLDAYQKAVGIRVTVFEKTTLISGEIHCSASKNRSHSSLINMHVFALSLGPNKDLLETAAQFILYH